ncbi:glycosyltransferase family 25 protein [Acinetobacter sp. SwsAc6]|uniref:Glycosyl transferase n=1 Tax=Acinetobacter cumulans TaxID=2136182 RepID=A0A498DAS0_9GAMM|nr:MULTISPECIES: glycosyltransferase family 25 protein [Acinetobacter]NWK74974.1 glycosyltransferase family 25 protein [Acinetobacter sp. SwsAc6]RFS31744.1 glycosyl transferase [Acinetobacter sp. SWAC5]RKG49386.1 glycosyl transferase [Acinetobacter cumulans]RLL37330.1 glycosyl transferase [Acinetobacter cumulans]
MKKFIVSIEEENSPRLKKLFSQPYFKNDAHDWIKIGIKGAELSAKKYFELGVKGRSRPLSPSMVGCTLSHLEALKVFLQSDDEFALILEDDAILPDDFDVVLLEQELKQANLAPQFLFSIGGIQMKECRKVRGEVKPFTLHKAIVLQVNADFYHRICYTVSYIVDRSMAKALIEYHQKLRAADDWRYIPDLYPNSRIYMAFIVDHPILESNVAVQDFSTIESERGNFSDVSVSKYGSSLRYNIAKFFNKKYPL